jgi:hypothetical protein
MSLRDVLEDDITTGDNIDDARLSLREATAEAFLVTFALVGTEGVLLRDRVSMSESVGPTALFGLLLKETVRIAERILIGHVATLEEACNDRGDPCRGQRVGHR